MFGRDRRKDRGDEPVHLGRDRWLFLTGGSNRVMDRYRGTLAQWRLIRAWTRLIRERAARAERLGVRCLHVVVPEKLSVYDHMTNGLRYDAAKATTRRLAKALARDPAYLDLLAPLRARRHGPVPMYLRTDTHWTAEGCLLAYREIMRGLGAAPPPDIGARPRNATPRRMDLGDKVYPHEFEIVEYILPRRDAVRVETGALLAAYEAAGREQDLHVGAHAVFRNDAPGADPRCLVIFGDSCAHFSSFMLTGFLAESFREVHFVWSSAIDWDYVARVGPDLLLFELAERFLARVPIDDYDVAVSGRRGTRGRLDRIEELAREGQRPRTASVHGVAGLGEVGQPGPLILGEGLGGEGDPDHQDEEGGEAGEHRGDHVRVPP
jgi:alginate O-acetyltransferase complex protein AlgJ